MIGRAALLAGLVLLSACASGGAELGRPGIKSYALGVGIASYDALRSASQKCEAEGGTIVPRKDADPAQLADYNCVIPDKTPDKAK